MKTKRLYYLLGLAVSVLIVWMVSDTFTQPGVSDLSMEFVEKAKYRNENNTGPIKRVYAVAVTDTLWAEMEKYGRLMPHTKYGNTQVYFFLGEMNTPLKVEEAMPYFEKQFEEHCVGRFEKKAMGEEGFKKYPFGR
ncbi:hypothetical protein GCM10028791_13410 [Echinicola sediminis]